MPAMAPPTTVDINLTRLTDTPWAFAASLESPTMRMIIPHFVFLNPQDIKKVIKIPTGKRTLISKADLI